MCFLLDSLKVDLLEISRVCVVCAHTHTQHIHTRTYTHPVLVEGMACR